MEIKMRKPTDKIFPWEYNNCFHLLSLWETQYIGELTAFMC